MTHWFKRVLLYLLPHHPLSRIVQWSARCRRFPFRKSITRWFVRHYNVDMAEALEPDPNAYPDFNSFFTRTLRPEARPVAQEAGQICFPADSAISQLGDIHGEQIFQAKGHTYSLIELLGGSKERARPFEDGRFAIMYLSPGDYHRVHMPLSGRLVETVYIPGRLFSVAPDYTESVPRLFARNERVACIFQTETGPMAVVLVGAIFVGSIETVWAGEITPPRSKGIKVTSYTASDNVIQLERGEEMGRFNLGSTVIVLATGKMVIDKSMTANTEVKLGQCLAVPAEH